MTDLPEPLTPADCDLRDFSFMPLDVVRLRDSDLAAMPNAEVFRAAVLAWCVAWHQQPAGSLPDDDALLARLLGYGRDTKGWIKLRAAGALHRFVKCSDGRLYHPVVAEKAVDAWQAKKAQRDRTEKARQTRLSQSQSQTENSSVTENVTASKGQGQGRDREKEEAKSDAPAALSARKAKGSALPDNFPGIPQLEYAREYWKNKGRPDLCERGADIAEEFRDHHTAKGTTSKDWDASWRTWCKNAIKFERPPLAPRGLFNGNGHGLGNGRIAPTLSEADEWRRKVGGFKEKSIWRSPDGPPPNDPDCLVPRKILAEFGYGATP